MKGHVAGSQATRLAGETADAEVHRFDGLSGNSRRQAHQVARPVNAYAIERKQVVAQIAAACEEGREAFRARRDARTRHRELDGVVLADRAQNLACQGFRVCGKSARKLVKVTAQRRLDGWGQRINLESCRQGIVLRKNEHFRVRAVLHAQLPFCSQHHIIAPDGPRDARPPEDRTKILSQV